MLAGRIIDVVVHARGQTGNRPQHLLGHLLAIVRIEAPLPPHRFVAVHQDLEASPLVLVEVGHEPAFLAVAVVAILLGGVDEHRSADEIEIESVTLRRPPQAAFQQVVVRVTRHHRPGRSGEAGYCDVDHVDAVLVIQIPHVDATVDQLLLVPLHGGPVQPQLLTMHGRLQAMVSEEQTVLDEHCGGAAVETGVLQEQLVGKDEQRRGHAGW